MPDRCASPGVKASAAPIQRAHVLGLAPLPAEPTRLYRDAHRVVLKAKAPFAGYVREVRLRLHGRPAGPADGSGWDVCSYSTRAGDMGEAQGYLVEECRQAIRVKHLLHEEQAVRVAPPLYLEAGQYVGVQNTSGELCDGWRASGGGAVRGGVCLSLDDESEHGQYVWKFEGGVASERDWPRGQLKTAGRLKERHVGFCAMLSGGGPSEKDVGKDVFAPVHRAVGVLKGLGVADAKGAPVGVCIGAGACAPHRSRSANNTTQAALKTAYSAVSNRLGGATPSLIVAAYTCMHEAKQVAEGLRELAPNTPFVGVSSCQGVVANGLWCSSKKTAPGNQTALGLWAISDDGGDYQIIHIPDSALGDDPDDLTTRQLAQQVVADRVAAATTGRRTPSFVLCFSAFGFSEAVLEGVKDAVDDGVPVFGGTAADNDVTEKWSLFSSEGGVSQKGVVVVLGRSSVEVACCMTSGFKPTERKGVATKVDGYWLKEIDDRPALAMYNEWTNSEGMVGLTTNSSGTTLIKDASSWQPLGVPLDDADKEFRVLHPMKADSAAGSLKLAGSVTEGTNLTLLRGDADSLVDHLLESCERIEVEAKECLGAFMILCGGLVMAMEEEIKEVYEKLTDVGGKRASLGMCAFGEQGPNCNRESMHGNLMFGVLMFSNKPVRPTR